jgi:hypothetical protein
MLNWQQVRDADSGVIRSAQAALQVGAVLLALLAVAGLAVLTGRRAIEQTRRVGLLKAVGGTPGLIALVLLIEHLLLAARDDTAARPGPVVRGVDARSGSTCSTALSGWRTRVPWRSPAPTRCRAWFPDILGG